ncbi:hypothetical protein FGO68_gene17309 [Halteria grandinella]|uniref:Uncharacterized protein n=1 Tax=Halteria grandinella TaxID=5974 RepID=A0A8J8T547_HALGN|nr:hypothetical protein FGO68_gene17309 [Halteria grandinella]
MLVLNKDLVAQPEVAPLFFQLLIDAYTVNGNILFRLEDDRIPLILAHEPAIYIDELVQESLFLRHFLCPFKAHEQPLPPEVVPHILCQFVSILREQGTLAYIVNLFIVAVWQSSFQCFGLVLNRFKSFPQLERKLSSQLVYQCFHAPLRSIWSDSCAI